MELICINVEYLSKHPQYIETVSNWIYNEFVIKSKSKFQLEQVFEFFNNTDTDYFPITLIAIKDGECIGTISVFENDLKTQNDFKPWLASLVVNPNYRNQGIGRILIDKALERVKELGFSRVYLRTEHASGYYIKRGWIFLCKAHDEYEQETEVFKYDI